jgi:hypothetical protein
MAVSILGGTLSIDSADDAIHTDGDVTVSGGMLTLKSGDDGIHADASLTISGGSVTVSDSYEGLEAADIVIEGGEISVRASDDGLNAAGGSDGSNGGGWFGGDPFASQDASITISGGTLTVNSDGDGIDSNGDLTVSGGTIFVSGPTNSGNGALDYNGSGVITGGTLIAAGASGMAENFSNGSTQCSVLVNFSSTVSAGSEICVYDSDGTLIASYTPEKNYQCAVISAPKLAVGETCTVTAGGAQHLVHLIRLQIAHEALGPQVDPQQRYRPLVDLTGHMEDRPVPADHNDQRAICCHIRDIPGVNTLRDNALLSVGKDRADAGLIAIGAEKPGDI